MMRNRPNIYLAAPLFSPMEREWNKQLSSRMAEISDVYLPQEDGGLLIELVSTGMSVHEAKAKIFNHDIDAIERCDILLLVMDGRVIDEGACFELGYAFSRGKVCVGLKTDVRSLLSIGDNPMIECALRSIFGNVEDAFEWVRNGKWRST